MGTSVYAQQTVPVEATNTRQIESNNSAANYDVMAIYYGDWHVDPDMSALHGPNWTEW